MVRRWACGRSGRGRRIDLIFHPVGLALDDDGLGAVENAVEYRAGDPGVVIKNLGPAFEGLVGGDDDGAALVALADDLEEQIGAELVERKISKFVNNGELWTDVLFEFRLKPVGGLGGDQVVERVDGRGEQDRVAALAGFVAEGDSEMRFT